MPIPAHDFHLYLTDHRLPLPKHERVTTVQINVGKLCNQACLHCHVEAGPKRTEIMEADTADRILELLRASPSVEAIDLTGGAPELNPSFRRLVDGTRELGRRVIVRCNLTVLFEPGMEWLPEYFRDRQVELVCSLPCYTAENVDKQRGKGVFDKSIRGMRALGALGYGTPGSGLLLDLAYNPLGASLPPDQVTLQDQYREELDRLFGIRFNRLLTITNMPIKRFDEMLQRNGERESYMDLLVGHFNPSTLADLMCRQLISVGWEGSLYDCDFNQMLEMPLQREGRALRLEDLHSFDDVIELAVATADHCFGCTAGAGSSCGGSLA
ncbi:MAG: radical SAM/Cys-rich protein [Hyphomicrobiaceae bacterium]|jgi:radical SAM/Cys-rich protein